MKKDHRKILRKTIFAQNALTSRQTTLRAGAHLAMEIKQSLWWTEQEFKTSSLQKRRMEFKAKLNLKKEQYIEMEPPFTEGVQIWLLQFKRIAVKDLRKETIKIENRKLLLDAFQFPSIIRLIKSQILRKRCIEA